MKKTLKAAALALTLLGASTATAAPIRSILVRHTDGTSTHITMMTKEFNTSFADGMMRISSEKGTLEYPLANLSNWTFKTSLGEVWAGVEATEAETFTIKLQADGVALGNLPSHSSLTLAGTDGRTHFAAEAEGNEFISFDGLTGGVYLLTINGKTFKIAIDR